MLLLPKIILEWAYVYVMILVIFRKQKHLAKLAAPRLWKLKLGDFGKLYSGCMHNLNIHNILFEVDCKYVVDAVIVPYQVPNLHILKEFLKHFYGSFLDLEGYFDYNCIVFISL